MKYKKTGRGRIETAGDFSMTVNPYLWKRLKKNNKNYTYFLFI